MSRLAGKSGGVYANPLELNDGEAAWSELVDADVTASADAADFKVGAKSAKFACAAGLGAGDIIATEAFEPEDLSGCKKVYLWIKSSVGLASGDLQLLLDNTAQCASPLKSLNIPALTAATWTRVLLDLGDASTLTAVVSVGLKQVVDKGAFNLWVDDIEALTAVAGIKEWKIDYKVNVLDSTAFDSAGVSTFVPGVTSFTGSFSGYKDGAPLAAGPTILALAESTTSGQCWLGDVLIDGISGATAHDGLVSAAYTFTGTGALEFAKL